MFCMDHAEDAAQHLSQGEGHGVLRVGAPDLDDVLELHCLCRQGVVQSLQPGEEHVIDLLGGCNVHGCGKRVVGALRGDTPPNHRICREGALLNLMRRES